MEREFYAGSLRQGAMSTADVAPKRQLTEMESLAERLASNLQSLQEINAQLENRLDSFVSAPTNLVGHADSKGPPPPAPGSLAYLQSLTSSTNEEIARLSALSNRVRTIL